MLSRECHLREYRQKSVSLLAVKFFHAKCFCRSYAEVVKAGTNWYNTRFKPTDCNTNFLTYDHKANNVNTTVTNKKHNGNAIDVVHSSGSNPVNDKCNDTHSRDKDKVSGNYDNSQ